ncbi:Crp/Fnr family transcriptional regulator [Piscinibacter koreensis]|uniref:Crp/Fnr family transcriptional regulator n=1 Tax=Piscinibacter koreensis TaxID=2742824 RepID=A0A7Y6TWB6_9BURK|nr:Crp/Fnr family transcriptional regulator [Schlegelella koreensis]NUZ05915.1 Crp/Fnr family transcriptional regulator [Schlegelella koreensis]
MNEDRIPEDLLESLGAHGHSRSYRAGAILINEGDPGDAIYIVLSGRLQTYLSSEDGRDVVLADHDPGEYVGELALDGSPRSASVRAVSPSTCLIVRGAELRAFLVDHPEFGFHLSQKLTRMVRRLTKQVANLALKDVYGRVVYLFMETSEAIGSERIIREKLTQQNIAERIGSSREMVSRVLKDLTAGGYVSLRDGCYVIHRRLPSAR